MDEIPDYLPDEKELLEQTALELMESLKRCCEDSQLPPLPVLGALEAAKHLLIQSWNKRESE